MRVCERKVLAEIWRRSSSPKRTEKDVKVREDSGTGSIAADELRGDKVTK